MSTYVVYVYCIGVVSAVVCVEDSVWSVVVVDEGFHVC